MHFDTFNEMLVWFLYSQTVEHIEMLSMLLKLYGES